MKKPNILELVWYYDTTTQKYIVKVITDDDTYTAGTIDYDSSVEVALEIITSVMKSATNDTQEG